MSGELVALFLSLALEAPVLLLATRAQPWPRRLLAALLPTLLTHPVAWELAGRLGPDDYLAGFVLIEGTVVLAEAAAIALLLRWRPWRALAASVLANATSALLGGALLPLLNGVLSS